MKYRGFVRMKRLSGIKNLFQKNQKKYTLSLKGEVGFSGEERIIEHETPGWSMFCFNCKGALSSSSLIHVSKV